METLTFLITSTFYPPYHLGGACIQAKYLAEELAKIGHEVHVLYSLDAYEVKKGAYRTKKRGHGLSDVHTHVIKTALNSSAYAAYFLGNSPAITKKFRTLVRQTRPDVVHHHNISLLGSPILKKCGDYLNLYTAQDAWLICQNGVLFKNGREPCGNTNVTPLNMECLRCILSNRRPLQIWRAADSFRRAVRQLDFIIAPSDYMKRKLLKQTQCLNIVMIPYFVPEPPGNIHSSGFSDFFLYAGRLDAPKGIVELIYLCKRGEFKLVVVGDGPLTDTVVALLRSNGLGDRITYLGYVDSRVLYPLLRDANALIIPSICGESSPQIAHEALSVGTPVIGSNNGGLPEIIEKIDKSLIFSSFDELNDIILGFSRNRYPSDEVRGVYDKYYSPRSYVESYKSLIDRSANVSLNSPESSVDRVTQEC